MRGCDESMPDAVCWPCEAGFACNSSRVQCRAGYEWSGVGATECSRCSGGCGVGLMLVRECGDGVSDRVCAECPRGFGCDGSTEMRMCVQGTYSRHGVCVSCGENHTTKGSGAKSIDECVCLYASADDQCLGGCLEGEVAVGGECRACPPGFGCDHESGQLHQCERDTYSSPLGVCVACGPNAQSPPGTGSVDECMCDVGYVKEGGVGGGGRCVACKAGTVYDDGQGQQCLPCPAGKYCLGRLHSEPCPEDMYSHQGSAVCSLCRMNSGCVSTHDGSRLCINQANCTCDDGFVDHGGECRRCPAATMKPLRKTSVATNATPMIQEAQGCVPCPRGMECLGGAEVRSCDLATYSGGNRSRCSPCTLCREITVARCNATHDSVCEATPYALAVLTLTQYYKTLVEGETFAMYAMVLASSLPKAQLVKVCGGGEPRCVHCFQGQCPVARMKQIVVPGSEGMYELVVEIRSNAARLSSNVESLTQTSFLAELAKTTMSKLTDTPFALRSRVEHAVICPDEAQWNGGECSAPLTVNAARTWLGLGVSIVLLAMLGAYRGQRRRWAGEEKKSWARVEEEVVDEEEEEDEAVGGRKG